MTVRIVHVTIAERWYFVVGAACVHHRMILLNLGLLNQVALSWWLMMLGLLFRAFSRLQLSFFRDVLRPMAKYILEGLLVVLLKG